jgi:hypothetical protein
MGRRLLGELPQTKNWRKVIDLLRITDDPAKIASHTSQAAQRGLDLAKKDGGVADVTYMLMKLVWSARGDDFRRELAGLGMALPEKASLLDVVGAFDESVDTRLRKAGHRTDLAEMARFAAVEALSNLCSQETGSLFGVSTEQPQQTLKRNAPPERFDPVGKDFFGRFLYRFLDYHLSRDLPNHVGPGRQFADMREYAGFKDAFERHCRETVFIVKDFSGCWPSATEFREGISAENVRTKFLPVALKKIQKELKRREGAHA